MKQELQDKLFKKYPKIFAQKDLPMDQTSMCWGVTTGDGWYNIIDTLCQCIQTHVKRNIKKDQNVEQQVIATQVKEKFGGLRFYYNGGNDIIEGLVWMAETLSNRTCEECGNPGTQYKTGWIRTLCKPCIDICDKIERRRAENDL